MDHAVVLVRRNLTGCVMGSRVRPDLPRGRAKNALTAPSIPIDAAALLTDLDEDRLLATAENGWFPPWVAFKAAVFPRVRLGDPRWLWRFSHQISTREAERHINDGWLWLERVHLHDSDLTAAWAADVDIDNIDLAQIAEWCRCAHPDPLRADTGMFALWCADHQHGPQMTAHRHHTLLRWFEMLRSEGTQDVAELHPADGTQVKVTVDA